MKKKIRVLNFTNGRIDAVIFKYDTKNGIVIKQSNTYKEIHEIPQSKIASYLCINTSEVITKQGAFSSSTISQIVPNISSKSFFYNIYKSKNSSWASLIRKEQLRYLLKQLKLLKHSIEKVFIGPYTLHFLANHLKHTELIIPGYTICCSDEIETISKTKKEIYTEKTYTVKNDDYKAATLIPMGIAISIFSKTSESYCTNYDSLNYELKTHVFNKLFKKLSITIGLSLVFTALLFNNILLFHFNSKLDCLKTENATLNVFTQNTKKLKSSVSRKEQLVNLINNNTYSNSTLLIDKIVSTLPELNIELQSLEYQPLLKKLKKDSKISYQKGYLEIKGKCSNNNAFNKWIKDLEILNFIKRTEITSFKQQGSFAMFQLEIELIL